MSIFFGLFIMAVGLVATFMLLNSGRLFGVLGSLVLGGLIAATGAYSYNPPGTCSHVRTLSGKELGVCNAGWFFSGWGSVTEWPHYISVVNNGRYEKLYGAEAAPYSVKMNDNWKGTATQATRFAIPQNEEQFLKMVNTFRGGVDTLINDSLRPTLNSVIDSVGNMYSMEEYYAGGKRDEFKNEFERSIKEGRAEVFQRTVQVNANMTAGGQGAAGLVDDAEIGTDEVKRIVTEKRRDSSGKDIRVQHDFTRHGIRVDSAIFENIEPDDLFENRIQARKDAASQRMVAQTQRSLQEENRLLAIQKGETEIAVRQAEARVEQIGATTNAETQKKLALIENERQLEAARIARQTAEEDLLKAKIVAEGTRVTADAEAHAKKVILEADGALSQKLENYLQVNRAWADALKEISVPQMIMGGGNGGTAVDSTQAFMDMMMVKAAKDLSIDTEMK